MLPLLSKRMGHENYRVYENITYTISAVLVVIATAFQIAKPFTQRSARGLSTTFIVIGLIAILARLPYFVLRAKDDHRNLLSEFGPPVVFLSVMVCMYVTLLAVKLYWNKKEDKDKDKA